MFVFSSKTVDWVFTKTMEKLCRQGEAQMTKHVSDQKIINRPSPKVERSTWSIGAGLGFESADFEATGKEVDLMVNIQGFEPVYRTVQRAFPA